MASETFTYTGDVQSWTVPSYVNRITVECWGASGGDNSQSGDSGGDGGYATGVISVSGGDTLYIRVGGRGQDSFTEGHGGWPNGGDGGYVDSSYSEGAGGGGSSGVRLNGDTQSDIVVLAGGGGGCGHSERDETSPSGQTPGADGGGEGQDSSGYYDSPGAVGGGSGSWQGGNGESQTWDDGEGGGGGGGGGLNGGEGGVAEGDYEYSAGIGGAGGDGYVGGASNTSMSVGVNTGDGEVVLTYYTAPTLDSIDASTDRENSLSWTNNDSYDEINVLRALSSGSSIGDYSTIATLSGGTSSYTDTGLNDGEQYFYRIEGIIDSETVGASNEMSAVTNLPAPTDLSVSNVGDTSADLSWNAHHNYGNTRIEYKQSDESSWTSEGTVSRSTESYSLTGLLHGEQYDVRVLSNTEHTSTEDQ